MHTGAWKGWATSSEACIINKTTG